MSAIDRCPKCGGDHPGDRYGTGCPEPTRTPEEQLLYDIFSNGDSNV